MNSPSPSQDDLPLQDTRYRRMGLIILLVGTVAGWHDVAYSLVRSRSVSDVQAASAHGDLHPLRHRAEGEGDGG